MSVRSESLPNESDEVYVPELNLYRFTATAKGGSPYEGTIEAFDAADARERLRSDDRFQGFGGFRIWKD